MGISISGSTAISGLSGSDTNFDTVLEQLYAVEKTQINQLQSWKSDWQLRYDAFNTVIDQMSAAKNMLRSIGSVNNFVTKKASSSDETVLTAIATGSAASAQHKLNVSQIANNAIWCNTGATFDTKSDIINKTGETVNFSFDYAGKKYSYAIAPNTTLESFVSIINNASNNPGVNISLVNTGSGYVYQIAGKSTGASNSLTIYSCGLEGMDNSSATSVWKTNAGVDPTASLTNPTTYTYTAVLNSGSKISFSLKGDATEEDLATALQNAAGAGLITTSIDDAGNLLINGVSSLSRTANNGETYTPGGLKLTGGADLSAALLDNDPATTLDVTITLEDGNTRTFSVSSDKTQRDFFNQVKQSLGSSASLKKDTSGNYQLNLSGIQDISIDGYSLDDLGFAQETYEAEGTADATSTSIAEASTALTFAQSTLSSRIDGKSTDSTESGESLRYTIVAKDGSAIYVDTSADGTTPLTSDMTNEQLLSAIKAAMNAAGKTVDESTDDSGNTVLTLEDVKSIFLSTGSSGTSGFTSASTASIQVDDSSFYTTTDEEGNQVRLLEEPPSLTYSVVLNDGSEYSVTLESGSTLEDVADALSSALAGTDSTVSLVDANGDPWVDTATSGEAYLNVTNIQSLTGSCISGQIVSSSNWSITNASNAIYQVDNWPMSMESESNTITDLLDGVQISLQGVGESSLTITTDVSSVETSIQNFLDAVNSVLMTIRDLTAVDDDKEVTSNDPNDIGNSNYSKSTLTSEKGGLLTGNYGVQLVKSRFSSIISSTPPGFQAISTADDMLSGDILSCLSNLGIKTDTTQTSPTYGLLVISPQSSFLQQMDEENYQDMINNHIDEVVDFFVTDGKGTSSSADFRYSSHVAGITGSGVFDVEYEVDANGQISNVTIGGQPCARDETRGGYYYTCTAGDARGLAISIDDLTEGSHSGQVRIKQGLVQTVANFLDKELTFNDVNISTNAPSDIIESQIALKSENGAMMTLKANYASIMANIDKSIDKEQRRLDTWYKRQKNIFANLETLLAQMNSQKESLESQLEQLS
ncbi:MAG: flagellar filament capping protein FliD [Desulfovibrio sp.]|nr:flagellar filament capping protein FliD [Desulfovibrio sp.]